eukprot:4861318-Ditylum_brightwellii.AAC.1
MDRDNELGQENEPEADNSMDGEDKLGDDGEQLNDLMGGEGELGDDTGIINSLMEGKVSGENEDDLTVGEYNTLLQHMINYLENLEVE